MKTKIKLIAIDNLIKIAYLCKKPLNMMMPDKLYKFAKARTMYKLLNTKATLLIQTIEDLHMQTITNLPVDLIPFHDSLTDVVRISPTKLSLKFFGEEMLLECQVDVIGKGATFITYNIVDDHNDYPNKKAIHLESMTIKIDEYGNVTSVSSGVDVHNTVFVYGYVELLFDWYSNERKIVA